MALIGSQQILVALDRNVRAPRFFVGAIVVLWVLRSLRQTLWSLEPNLGRTISQLLAGIVLVDWLAVADAPRELGFVFIGLFLLALGGERWVPAT